MTDDRRDTLLRRCESLLTMHDRSKAWDDERKALLAQLREVLSVPATAHETCERHICWACQATYAGPRAEGKCSRCASGADPVRAVAWVGFPADQPKPDYDVAYDDASKLPGHSYTAIYWQPPAQKASEGQS